MLTARIVKSIHQLKSTTDNEQQQIQQQQHEIADIKQLIAAQQQQIAGFKSVQAPAH